MLVSPCIPHNQYQMACVIDPALALSRHGVALVKGLGHVIELWVARELWHILNDTDFYIKQPQLLTPREHSNEKTAEQEYHVLEETILALKEWKQFRLETDLTGLNLFWIGDSLRESFLPPHRNPNLFRHWEYVFTKIDAQLSQNDTADYILPSLFRDATALAATLESVTVLTYQTSIEYENNFPPKICKSLEQWGFFCKNLLLQDSVVALERSYFHDLFIKNSGSKFFLSNTHLSILHLLIPSACLDSQSTHWREAKGFWYSI